MQGKRYKFQGSSFAVQTALGANKLVSAITKASNGVLTSTGHGLAVGDPVYLDVADGMPEFTTGFYVVDAVPSANTFTVGVNTTNYTTFAAGSPNTNVANAITFTDFCELTSFNQQDAAADEIDVTTICSTAKEFEVGLSDAGSLSLEYNYAGHQPVQAALRAAKVAGTQIAFLLSLPGDGGTVVMFGSVQSQSISGSVSDVIKGTATIKLSGDVYAIEAA